MNVKIDETCKTVKVDPTTSLVRVDGIVCFKRIVRDGQVYLQFKDRDGIRANCRGTYFVEVPLDEFAAVLKT
jgi:hypothetical protein